MYFEEIEREKKKMCETCKKTFSCEYRDIDSCYDRLLHARFVIALERLARNMGFISNG